MPLVLSQAPNPRIKQGLRVLSYFLVSRHTTVLKIVQLTALLLQAFFIQQNVWYNTIWPGLYSQIDVLVSLSSDFQSIPQMRSSYYVFAMHL